MKTKSIALLVLAVVSILVVTLFCAGGQFGKGGEDQSTSVEKSGGGLKGAAGAKSDASGESTGDKTVAAKTALPEAAASILAQIEAALDVLKNGDEAQRRAALDLLDELFAGENRDAKSAIAAIMAFLKSGKDALTGEPFVVGEGGKLTTANTLRVFLMDHLGTLCAETKTPESLQAARDVLAKKNSADEWAISMRNMAWGDPNSGPFLQRKSAEMLDHEPWVKNPTAGMMEAFDVIVHTASTDLIPKLGSFSADVDAPLNRASAVALDRLAEHNPLVVADYLMRNPDALKDSPLVRADLFAKSDLGNEAQRQLIEGYLNRQDVSAGEKSKFLESLTAPGSFVSHSLLTPLPEPPTAQTESRRLETLHAAYQSWIDAGTFPTLQQPLKELASRTTASDQ